MALGIKYSTDLEPSTRILNSMTPTVPSRSVPRTQLTPQPLIAIIHRAISKLRLCFGQRGSTSSITSCCTIGPEIQAEFWSPPPSKKELQIFPAFPLKGRKKTNESGLRLGYFNFRCGPFVDYHRSWSLEQDASFPRDTRFSGHYQCDCVSLRRNLSQVCHYLLQEVLVAPSSPPTLE